MVSNAHPSVYVNVPQLLACALWGGYEVSGILVAKQRQRFLSLSEFDGAVCSKISTWGTPVNEAATREERLGTTVVSGAEMDLC